MPIEKSVGAIIFRKGEKGEILYLLLNYSAIGKIEKSYWGFPKGHIEKREKEIETIKREIKEETGIEDINFVENFKETEKYFFKFKRKNILKFVTYYLVETKTKKVKLSFEHIGYKWLPYKEALEQLTFQNTKEILKKANDYLIKEIRTEKSDNTN